MHHHNDKLKDLLDRLKTYTEENALGHSMRVLKQLADKLSTKHAQMTSIADSEVTELCVNRFKVWLDQATSEVDSLTEKVKVEPENSTIALVLNDAAHDAGRGERDMCAGPSYAYLGTAFNTTVS